MLRVEPENIYAEEGLGLTDGDEVDHLDDLLRADGQWPYYGVEAENFFSSSGARMRPPPRPSWRSSKSWATASEVPRGPEPPALEP